MPRTRANGPRRRRRRLLVAVVVVAAVVLAGGGVLAWRLTRPTTTAAATERVVTVSRETLKQTVGATGTVEPARRADLSFATSGTVTKVFVAVGDKVAKGDVLANVDDDALQADLDAARADLDAAEGDLTTAEDASDTTSAQLAAAKAKVAVAKNSVSQAKTAVANADLKATFAGTVAAVGVAKGDTVGSGSSGGAGAAAGGSSSSTSSTAAVTVISTDRYTVAASVGSADLASVKKGLQAQITTTGSTSTIFGTVSSVAVMASSASAITTSAGAATFAVDIDVTGARTDLYAGATATVSIIVSQRDNVLTVPTAAVTTANGQTVVTKLVGTEKVATPVTLGTVSGQTTEVTEGLAEGDQVVITFAARVPGGTASTRAGTGQNGYGGQNGGTGGFGGGAPPAGGGAPPAGAGG